MSRFKNALAALMISLCALALSPVTRASALSGQSRPTTQQGIRSIVPQRLASSGPRIWHVLIGGQSEDDAIQAEGYYPRVITIDAGDTVVWTLNTGELHSVTFQGTCTDISCVPPCVFTVNIDISPCGPTTFDGVTAIASSGRMVPAGYNWNNAVPH